MSRIVELTAEFEKAKAEAQAKVENMKEEAKLVLEINKVSSPLYVTRELQKEDNARLQVIIDQVEEVYVADRRKLSQVFGYGSIPNKIIMLARAIQYSKIEEKQDFLMMTGLDESTVEELLEAFGNTAYFSVRELVVVESIPMDIPKVRELLQICADDMKLVSDLNLSKFNTAYVAGVYKRAQLKAEEALDNTIKYASEDEITYTE